MNFEEIVKEYLAQCANICNKGGSYSLYLSRESIEKSLISKFINESYSFKEVSSLIKICEKEVFSYIEENKGFYSWSLVDEDELKRRIRIALQQV